MTLKKAIPDGIGIEIGVGTGRFAEVLKIPVGVEPAHAMAQMAIARGITVINSKAEKLPFHSLSFDYAVMITTDCFLDNISKAFTEAHCIIKKNGFFIVAMIDKDSELGKQYEAKKTTSIWYKDAHFHSVHEITDQLQQAGFTNFEYWQTLFTNKEELTNPLPGFGKGGFVVIRSQKI
jgi:ubiquinone/menaquinone biosynthesis C-methylase UbiE